VLVQGLSILARKQQPSYMLPFLHILQSVAAGATAEAAASKAALQEQTQQCIGVARALGLFEKAEHDSGLDDDADGDVEAAETAEEGDDSAAAGGSNADSAAARYFKRRMQRQAAEDNGSRAAAAATPNSSSQQPRDNSPAGLAGTSASGAAAAAQQCTADLDAADAAASLDALVPLPDTCKLQLSALQLEQLDMQWRRAYSAASLASAAAEAATPLLLQRSLRCAVLAASALSAALDALAAASDALDNEERLFDKLVAREPDAALKPARPAPVKLLPAVHAAWPLLLAALQDTRSVALLEQGLTLLCSMMQLAGGRFMARRFKQEAWPLLMRLAKQGPQGGASMLAAAAAASTTGGGASAAALLGVGQGPGSDRQGGLGGSSSGGVQHMQQQGGIMTTALQSLEAAASSSSNSWNDVQHGPALTGSSSGGYLQDSEEALAPATVQRVQVAVLACLQGICSSTSAAAAMQGPLIWDTCMLAAPYLADSQALPLREAAAKLLLAAGQVDADAVWLVLFDLGSCYQDLEQLLSSAAPHPPAAADDAAAADEASRGGVPQTGVGAAAAAAASAGSDQQTGIPLPKMQQLLPRASVKQAGSDSSSLQRLLCSSDGVSCGKRAAALLPRVAQLPVSWHARAEQQLLQLQSASAL
jgi:hypothetical protein